MKTLFIVSESLADTAGVSKKILAQANALRRLGMTVFLSFLKKNTHNEFSGRYVDDLLIDNYSRSPVISKIQYRTRFKNLYRFIKKEGIGVVFIRYTHFANPFFISFLRKLKKAGIITLLEIPTYPYDQEYQNLGYLTKFALSIEKLYRTKFKNCVTRIITLSQHNVIFGVPTIQISNGIDTDKISIIKGRPPEDEIHLIAVTSAGYWHGYDRVIEGLHNYYKEHKPLRKKVIFHVIGGTLESEFSDFREQIEKYNLWDFILFHGKRSSEQLDTFFDKAHMGVGTLAAHRKGLRCIRSLKHREYCARGIPFFYSGTDPDFEGKDFIYKVPSSEDPINIAEIVNFIEQRKFDPRAIREFALNNLTWESQFAKVFREITADEIMAAVPSENYHRQVDEVRPFK